MHCNSSHSDLYALINQVPQKERYHLLLHEDLVKKYHIVNTKFQKALIALGHTSYTNYGTTMFYSADPQWTKKYLGISKREDIDINPLHRSVIISKLMQKGVKCPETITFENLTFLAFLDGHTSARAKKTDYYQILQAWCLNPDAEIIIKPELH